MVIEGEALFAEAMEEPLSMSMSEAMSHMSKLYENSSPEDIGETAREISELALRIIERESQNGVGKMKEIRFYRTKEPFGCFSNFSAHIFFIDDIAWPTVEHYYQAMKFDDPEFRDEIRGIPSPMTAKQHAYTRPPREGWEEERDEVMMIGLRAKFSQHEDLRRVLLETGDAIIIEDSPIDSYWGCGSDGLGENMLGKMIMRIRDEIKESECQ